METLDLKFTIPEKPYSPPKISEEDPFNGSTVNELKKLVNERICSFCAIQYLYTSYKTLSKARIDFAILERMYSYYDDHHDPIISFSFKSREVNEIGLRGYDRGCRATAVCVIDSHNYTLYKDTEAEKEWWEEFKKLKKMAVAAEKAYLLGEHKPREKALIEYSILNYLFFKADFKIPTDGPWPF